MVVIFSKNDDASTDAVMDWLFHYNIPCKRINHEYFYDFKWDFQDQHNSLFGVKLSDIKVVWFRKSTKRLSLSEGT